MSVNDLFQGIPSTPPQKSFKFIKWHSPNLGRVKFNFDGSCQQNSAAEGYILRDWRGTVLLVGAANYDNTSIIMAECQPLRDGVQAAIKADYRMLDIEGDNMIIIGAVQGKTETPWQICNVIQDIQVLLSQKGNVSIHHIYKEANMTADWLSKFGHSITGVLANTECFHNDL